MIPFPTDLVTVDFETRGIQAYPDYPPKPCGVAIRWENGKKEYLAWGHAEGNNCTFEEAQRAVTRAFGKPCLFHNAAFDMEVAMASMGLPYPVEWHDTLYMAFLCKPHARSLSLKPLAEEVLRQAPEEKDALLDYGVKELGLKRSEVMAHVPRIPAKIVGPYAIGDVDRTYKLAVHFWDRINKLEMWDAYERERALMPYLLDSERRGVRVDRQLLLDWSMSLYRGIEMSDARLRIAFGRDINMDANEDVANALEAMGFVLPLTDTGKRSTSLPVLHRLLPPDLYNLISYRNKSATMLRTFVTPWFDLSEKDGRLHTAWSPVRNPDGNGTRTGRIASARPNLANIPNDQKTAPPEGCPPLPLLRRALLPEEGHVWLSADYSQQELRLAAHYEDEDLKAAYLHNPNIDLHQFVVDLVRDRTGIVLTRKQAKILGFAMIYGAGAPRIASQLEVDIATATTFRDAYLQSLPGIATLQRDTKMRFRGDRTIRTLGGRAYYCEPAKDGRSFEYKGLNVLIQGSAADQTKQAIINFCRAFPRALFLSQVYDELNVSVPVDLAMPAARALNEAMCNSIPIDVPVKADFEIGSSWGDLVQMGEMQ